MKQALDECHKKDDDIHKYQVDYVTLKRTSEHDLEQKTKNIDTLTDQFKVVKKYGERQKEDKDRLKKKLKDTEKSKDDLKKEIQSFKNLEQTLAIDRKRLQEQMNKFKED